MGTFTDRYLVEPGKKLRLDDFDPRDTKPFGGDKDEGRARVAKLNARLEELQEALYAEGRHRLLVVLQGLDSSGKDGTIRTVFDGVNPQGVKVACFKKPTSPELAHDFLWRVHPHTPACGEIAIWNRSHYEDVLIARVHELVTEDCWKRRYEHIRAFESLLADEGTTILKFFLHIGKDEQRQRLQERIDDPKKRWKWNKADLEERRHFDDYRAAYEDALSATAAKHAPWYVVPADRNWYRDLVISEVLVATLEKLDIRLPPGDPGIEDLKVT